jgi:hypothetical protein
MLVSLLIMRRMLMVFMIMRHRLGVRPVVLERLGGLRRIEGRALDHLALDAIAMATAAASIAMAGTAAVAGAVFVLFLGLAMSALPPDQRLSVGDRDLIIVGMDFAKGQESVAVAAIFDEGRLQRGLTRVTLAIEILPRSCSLRV